MTDNQPEFYRIMRITVFTLIALLLAVTANAQTPFDVDLSKTGVKVVGNGKGSGTPSILDGQTLKSENKNDPLYYYVISEERLLVEVSGKIRSANLHGRIVIPDYVEIQGKTFKVVNIGEEAFENCRGISSVEIKGNSLQKLCNYCFKGCTGLTEITLNSNCLNLKSTAFSGCSYLRTIKASKKANNFSFSGCNAQVVKY